VDQGAGGVEGRGETDDEGIMKILDPGHQYELESYDGEFTQVLQFMKRMGAGYPGNLNSYPGTNCQEIIRVLINRIRYLDRQISCGEDREMLQLARRMLWLFESRAAKRKGLSLPRTIANIELRPTCPQCGHILCHHF
jgi:hypothetical protein